MFFYKQQLDKLGFSPAVLSAQQSAWFFFRFCFFNNAYRSAGWGFLHIHSSSHCSSRGADGEGAFLLFNGFPPFLSSFDSHILTVLI